nr:hypothetical protein [Klenkia sp. PcliD-1-E]
MITTDPLAGAQVRDGGTDGAEGAGQHGADGGVPLLVGQVPGAGVPGDPGVGHDHVEPSEPGRAVGDGCGHGRAVWHVDLVRHGPPDEVLRLAGRGRGRAGDRRHAQRHPCIGCGGPHGVDGRPARRPSRSMTWCG